MEKNKYKEILNIYLKSHLKPQNIPKYSIEDAMRDYSCKSHAIKLELDIDAIQKRIGNKIFCNAGSAKAEFVINTSNPTIKEVHDDSLLDLLSNQSFCNTPDKSISVAVEDEESDLVIKRRKKKSKKKTNIEDFDFLVNNTKNDAKLDFDSSDYTESTDEDVEAMAQSDDSIEEECIAKDSKQ